MGLGDFYRFKMRFTKTTSGVPTQDAKGHFVNASGTFKDYEIPCRYTPNSQGRYIRTESGEAKLYDYIITMPLGYPDVSRGQSVAIHGDDDAVIQTGVVELFHKGLMCSKVWI